MQLGRAVLAAAAGLAAAGVAAGQAAGDGEADLAEAAGQRLVTAVQLGQVVGPVVILPRVCADTLFSDDATALIHTTARGYPRAVNNLALQALVATYANSKAIVDEQAARAAITEVTDT